MLACRRYTLFPFCYIAAIAATVFVECLSIIVSKFKIMKPVIYIGKNSMYMFWVHYMDYVVQFAWKRTGNGFINAALRIIIDIALFFGLNAIYSRKGKREIIEAYCINYIRQRGMGLNPTVRTV